jgi:hypothetical protein
MATSSAYMSSWYIDKIGGVTGSDAISTTSGTGYGYRYLGRPYYKTGYPCFAGGMLKNHWGIYGDFGDGGFGLGLDGHIGGIQFGDETGQVITLIPPFMGIHNPTVHRLCPARDTSRSWFLHHLTDSTKGLQLTYRVNNYSYTLGNAGSNLPLSTTHSGLGYGVDYSIASGYSGYIIQDVLVSSYFNIELLNAYGEQLTHRINITGAQSGTLNLWDTFSTEYASAFTASYGTDKVGWII